MLSKVGVDRTTKHTANETRKTYFSRQPDSVNIMIANANEMSKIYTVPCVCELHKKHGVITVA